MDDTYAYVAVKLYLKSGQTEDSIQEIIQECDYSFVHDDIIEHEIIEIIDTQILEEEASLEVDYVDPFDVSDLFFGD
jgi:hypothetical protein